MEQAAIGGHPGARHYIGFTELENGRIERGVKLLIIAANLGHDGALELLRKLYTMGAVRKEDFATALRVHQDAVDATKSPQREAGELHYSQNISE